jgi:glucose/arabinose dehydrogenase
MPAIRFRLTIPILIVLMLSAGLHSVGAASPSQGTPPSQPASAGPNANINLTLIASGLTRPVYVTAAPRERDRIFIVEKRGRIRIYKNGSLLPTSFLDVSTLVSYGNEQGLLSVAFHPNYANNGYFYVYYTNLSGNLQIMRYSVSANPDVADPTSAQTVIGIAHPTNTNHNGGQLQFGPDGYLYLGTGDGGSGGDPPNNAQNTGVLLGKMLRLDVDGGAPYAIPPTNPFVGPGNPLDEIWDLGLRNPWRYSFDRLTGDLWIGDVGQNAWEEVDLEPAGSPGGVNWGWRCMEGNAQYNFSGTCSTLTLAPPVHVYSHSNGCAITGGYVYRGSPNSPFFGQYFFADYCVANQARALSFNGSAWTATNHTLLPSGNVLSPNSFGQDGYGDLYIADDGSGSVYKMNLRPACTAGAFTTDVNGDGRRDILDVQLVAADFGRADFVPDYDLDCSGAVDVADIQAVATAWGS